MGFKTVSREQPRKVRAGTEQGGPGAPAIRREKRNQGRRL